MRPLSRATPSGTTHKHCELNNLVGRSPFSCDAASMEHRITIKPRDCSRSKDLELSFSIPFDVRQAGLVHYSNGSSQWVWNTVGGVDEACVCDIAISPDNVVAHVNDEGPPVVSVPLDILRGDRCKELQRISNGIFQLDASQADIKSLGLSPAT